VVTEEYNVNLPLNEKMHKGRFKWN